MNAERLHAMASAVRQDLRQTNAVKTLQQLATALQNQVNQPQQSEHQKQVADHFKRLTDALSTAPSNSFPPTWKQALEELDADALMGAALAGRVEEIFRRNQITPSVEQQEIQEIHQKLAAFQATIEQLLAAFSQLKIGAEELAPGTAELGVLIPREFVENKLDEFANELEELNSIFGVFEEVATGSRPGFTIHSISSTDLSLFLDLAAPVAACIAVAVERIVALYKQLLEIRKLHGELEKQGVPGDSLKGVEDYANKFMDDGIDGVVPTLLSDFYKNTDDGRRNELKIELRRSMRKIASRIDYGFNLEVRVEPVVQKGGDSTTSEESKYAEMIRSAAPSLQFLKREGKPILSLPEETEKDGEKKEKKKK